MDIEIRPLVPNGIRDYMNFFDNVAFVDGSFPKTVEVV